MCNTTLFPLLNEIRALHVLEKKRLKTTVVEFLRAVAALV
jgi:hypothetical protein